MFLNELEIPMGLSLYTHKQNWKSFHSIDQPQFLYNRFSLEPLSFVSCINNNIPQILRSFDTCWISLFSSYFLLNQFYSDIYTAIPLKLFFVKVTYDHSISKYSGKLLLVILLILEFLWLIQPLWYTISVWSESESRSVTPNTLWHHGLYSPWNSLGQNTGVGSLSLLQGIFPTQGLNPGFPHCRQILLPAEPEGVTTKYMARGSASWLSSHGRSK